MTELPKKDHLGEALGLPTLVDRPPPPPRGPSDGSVRGDFERARENVEEVIDSADTAIDELAGIANQSQHPRAYKVLSQLLKTKLECSREIMTLHRDLRDAQAADERRGDQPTVNNLFVGSSAELLAMLENEKKRTK